MGKVQDMRELQECILAIEDEEMKKCIKDRVYSNYGYMKYVDNEEKIGLYYITVSLSTNNYGKFYRRNKLESYIVYNRVTKKVAMGNAENISDKFIDKYFYNPKVVNLFLRFKLTKTFVKKVLTGKIQTIRDIIYYHNTYVTSVKCDEKAAALLLLRGENSIIRMVTDAENLKGDEKASITLNSLYVKVKCSELDNIKTIQDEWKKAQTDRVNEFISRGGFSDCNAIIREFEGEEPNFSF